MAAYPITIPGTSSRMVGEIMSPHSISSPLSGISSPYSAHSSLSNGSSNIGQALASSFATSVNSNASTHSPKSELDALESVLASDDGTQSIKLAPLSAAAAAALAASKKHKPHTCDICGASFARKVHLQRHSLRHQVCKPYCCERCGKCFSRQDSLVRHHRLLHEKVKDMKPKRGGSTVTGSKKKKNNTSTCIRCNTIGSKCDGNLPCNRCSTSEYNTQQCSYKISSSSTSDKRQERRNSVSQMTTSSTFEDEDDEIEEDMLSIAEEKDPHEILLASFGNGHGPRRYTVSNMESVASSMQNEVQGTFPRTFDDCFYVAPSNWSSQFHPTSTTNPHPFEMPQLDSMSFLDIKSLHPQQLHHSPPPMTHQQDQKLYDSTSVHQSPHQQEIDIPLLSLYPSSQNGMTGSSDLASNPTTTAAPSIPFDWTSLMHEALSGDQNVTMAETNEVATLPFRKAASDKSLNVTLSRSLEDNSCFSSPAIFPPRSSYIMTPAEQQQQLQQAIDAVTSSSTSAPSSATVNLASLGLPVPTNFNISVPADLQMSAENWDNLMRCLTNMASRPVTEVSTQS